MFKLFEVKDFDEHYTLDFLNKRILSVRHGCSFKYKEAFEYGVTIKKRTPQLIVSMTSFPARINTTHYALNTLLCQSLKPDRIILWLAEDQFPNKEQDLPNEVLKLKDLGLEIRWWKDIKSYKKLIPSLREFHKDIIITTDDDIYYEEDWLESLYQAHLKKPKCIISQRIRALSLKNGGIEVMPRKQYEKLKNIQPSYLNQMFGGTGTLYPPNSLHRDVFNTDKALRLLPTNDDVYFWAMAVLNNTKISVGKGMDGNLFQMNLKETSLSKINNEIEQNIEKDPFKIMCREYPQILDLLKEGI